MLKSQFAMMGLTFEMIRTDKATATATLQAPEIFFDTLIHSDRKIDRHLLLHSEPQCTNGTAIIQPSAYGLQDFQKVLCILVSRIGYPTRALEHALYRFEIRQRQFGVDHFDVIFRRNSGPRRNPGLGCRGSTWKGARTSEGGANAEARIGRAKGMGLALRGVD